MTKQPFNKKKRISIGTSDFQKLRQSEYYYIDKSLLIQEVLESGAEVLLLPRPRRFGKTLNLSMLRYFFEKSAVSQRCLFDDLLIAENSECMAYQGEYPVVSITFKDIQENNSQDFLNKIALILSEEYERHEWGQANNPPKTSS